nr:hypothetical protein [Tessaracoccus sp. ZS01]
MLLADAASPVDQQPQEFELVIGDHRMQTTDSDASQGDRVSVGVVSLASLSCSEHPHPRRQLRRYIHHLLTIGDQPLRDGAADALTALDRPDLLRPTPRVGQ